MTDTLSSAWLSITRHRLRSLLAMAVGRGHRSPPSRRSLLLGALAETSAPYRTAGRTHAPAPQVAGMGMPAL